MDLDRRKQDVDIIERVLGGMHDTDASQPGTRVFEVDIPGISETRHPTLELTIGINEPDDRGPKGSGPSTKA